MDLNTHIMKKKIGYWDFNGKQDRGIHNICVYPATMVPNMQKELIKMILHENPQINNVLDPFHGSGVTLVESASLGLTPRGIDINPLANLITRVKLQGINKKKIKRAIKNIEEKIIDEEYPYETHSFPNISKWYREDFIKSFSKIRSAIGEEKCANIRKYFWVCLIDPLKKYSNTRSSTFKLHIKEETDISSMENKVFDIFLENIKKYHELLPEFKKERKIELSIDNTVNTLEKMENESIDFICTSPPYGDNSTTVTYGQFSILPIYWIDNRDLDKFDLELIQNFSSIDSSSLGGKKKKITENFESNLLNKYLDSISENKRPKIVSFMIDYFKVLDKLNCVLKNNGIIMMTVGNRRVDNRILPLTELSEEFFLKLNYSLEAKLTRNIHSKRMPKKVSRVDSSSVESMNIEYVLIFRKNESEGANK